MKIIAFHFINRKSRKKLKVEKFDYRSFKNACTLPIHVHTRSKENKVQSGEKMLQLR